jgi:hypothetical protein
MTRHRILDLNIMEKIAKKTGGDVSSIRNSVNKKAKKFQISSEAALVILAKEQGIGTSTYQRNLDVIKQFEIRDTLPIIFASNIPDKVSTKKLKNKKSNKFTINRRTNLKAAIEYLIEDQVLLDRCLDILMAQKNFDRPINQATLVLENRIRDKAQPIPKLVGENLINHTFNEELSKTMLQVASKDSEDQRGFTQILRGIIHMFRNKTHHNITASFSREDAIRVLLRVIDKSAKVK